ncbi:MAG: ROK family protein [Clostridia bacterium]|nr:ROK family protein [Clostridia bacterium]
MKKVILAVDAGGTFLKSGLFIGAELVEGTLDREPVNSSTGELHEIKKSYVELLSRGVKKACELGLTLESINVDIPGPFDYVEGVSHMEHKYAAIKDVPLRPWFAEAAPGVPVRFMHDSAAFIQGAATDVPDCSRIAGVMIGTGFGFGMMIDGEPQRKENGEPLRELYDVPYKGTIAEEFVSARGLVRLYCEVSGEEAISGKEIGDRAEAGDAICVEAYNRMARALAEILLPTMNEFKIEALVLGGQISKSFCVCEDALREGLKGASSVRKIIRASDIDMVHLIGTAVGK